MEKIEVKIDKTTLPENLQWVEFETYNQEELVGQYLEEDEIISQIDNKDTCIYDVYYWRPLHIEWHFKEWTERSEGLAILIGFDKFGNEFTAGGEISLGEIIKVEDIEFVKK